MSLSVPIDMSPTLEGAGTTEAYDLWSTLAHMKSCVDDFEASLHLFDLSIHLENDPNTIDGNPILVKATRRWPFLAARSGAICLYNFKYARDAVPGQVKKVRGLVDRIEFAELGKAGSDFTKAFPDWAGIRHSAAHAGEFVSRPEERARHSVSGLIDLPNLHFSTPMMFVSGSLTDRTYFSTFEGRTVSYCLSKESYDALLRTARRVFDAISAVQAEPRVAPGS